ncbi:unnamed protein product, partial [Prorocentrum cordatum]
GGRADACRDALDYYDGDDKHEYTAPWHGDGQKCNDGAKKRNYDDAWHYDDQKRNYGQKCNYDDQKRNYDDQKCTCDDQKCNYDATKRNYGTWHYDDQPHRAWHGGDQQARSHDDIVDDREMKDTP